MGWETTYKSPKVQNKYLGVVPPNMEDHWDPPIVVGCTVHSKTTWTKENSERPKP